MSTLKIIKNDFRRLFSYIKENILLFIFQAVFFFVGLAVLIWTYQLGFISFLQQSGNQMYSQVISAATLNLPYLNLFLLLVYAILWFLALALVYTFFQGTIWFLLSKTTKKTVDFFKDFLKQSLSWAMILFGLLFIRFIIAAVFLTSKSNLFENFLSALKVLIVLFFAHGLLSQHAQAINWKVSVFESIKNSFKITNLRTTIFFAIYLVLINLIAIPFQDIRWLSFIFLGIFLCGGTIAYYITLINTYNDD